MMRTFHCIKLKFNSPLHLGRGIGEAYDTGSKLLHSDTLSAALTSARAQIFGSTHLYEYIQSLRISSAFPYYKNHFFFPKPMIKLNIEISEKDEHLQAKILKKLEYIELPVFEKLIAGKNVTVNEKQLSNNKKYLWAGDMAGESFVKKEVQQRVTVPRDLQGNSEPYYVERLFFDEEAGLFFLMDCNSDRILRETEVALKLLEDTGLGTDRSVGNGFFKYFKEEFSIHLPEDASWLMSLSLFCPEKEELPNILDADSAYLLEKRGGFISGSASEKFRHLRKKSIYMFTEGSVFKGSRLHGKVFDLRPAWNDDQLHPVYRSGIPLTIPVIKNNV